MTHARSSVEFSQTVRGLGINRSRWSIMVTVFWSAMVGLWCAWFCLARVPLYETTNRAQLEAAGLARPVESSLPGLVVENHAELGREVQAGQVITRLDDRGQRILLAENENKAVAFELVLAEYDDEMAASRTASDALVQAESAEHERQQAAIATSEQRYAFARHQAVRIATLATKNVVSQVESDQAVQDVAIGKLQLVESRVAMSALAQRHQADAAQRGQQLANIKRQRAEMLAEVRALQAERAALRHEIEVRQIRAPISGRIGRVGDFPPGATIAVGETLAAIVPAAEPRIVAQFPAAAIGRLKPGQRAEVRLQAYPWTQFGSLPAEVTEVGDETRNGWIRVELKPLSESLGEFPLQHGLTGTVQASIESVTPLTLVLRAVGRSLSGARTGK